MQDNLHNVYQGSDAGHAFSDICRMDSLSCQSGQEHADDAVIRSGSPLLRPPGLNSDAGRWTRGGHMTTQDAPVSGLASVGLSVLRSGLATTLLWVGALKFTDYEVQNAEVLVTASPLTARLRQRLGARRLGQAVGVVQLTLGSLIASKRVAPAASAAGSLGAAAMMCSTLSFLVTTPEAWQEGKGVPRLSMLGEALLKDSVLLGAALLTAAESLGAVRAAQ
jgi:reactive chlorine resistance protein C